MEGISWPGYDGSPEWSGGRGWGESPGASPRRPDEPGDPANETSDRADDGLGRPDRTPGPRRACQDQPPGVIAEGPASGVHGPDASRLGQEPAPGGPGPRRRPDTGRVGPDQRLSSQDLGGRSRPLL